MIGCRDLLFRLSEEIPRGCHPSKGHDLRSKQLLPMKDKKTTSKWWFYGPSCVKKFMFELPRSLYPFHGSCTCEPLLNQDGCHPKKTTNHRDVFLCRNLHWECQFQTDGNTFKFGRFPSLRICLCALWNSMKSIVKVTCLCSFWGALISRLLVCGFNLSEKYARQNGFIFHPFPDLETTMSLYITS